MQKSIPLIALVVFLSFSLLFANNLVPAYASTVVSQVTLPTGAVGIDTQMYPVGNSNLSWWTASLGGQIWLYTKPNNIYTPSQAIQLSGGGGGQMTYDTFRNHLIVFTSAGVYIFAVGTSALSLVSFTSNSGYTGINDAVYDANRDRVYSVKISVSPPAIFDMSPTDPNTVTTWSNTNMGGYNAFLAGATGDLAIDADDGKLFVNAQIDGTHMTVVMIDHLTGTWNETKTTGSILGTIYGIATDPDFNWLVATISDGSAYKKFDTATIGNANMTLLATVSTGTIPRYIEVEPNTHIGFIGRSSANNVTIFDNSADTIISTNQACTNPIGHLSVKAIEITTLTPTVYATVGCGTNNVQSIVSYGAGAIENPTTGGIDCSLPANANILICRLGGDGTLGSAGAFVIGNITRGTGILGIGCSMGVVDCTQDQDPRTNGLGLLIFIATIFVIIGMFYYTIGRGAFEMPIFIWAVIIIALSAFFTITGLIDPVFLILSVIAIIALTVPKLKGIIGGGGTFGGGSTE